ncbi:MAG: hypothetical protein IJC33_01680 [Clostridia bacterium]|nr:hypothetical protein [Clostridia bacterium]
MTYIIIGIAVLLGLPLLGALAVTIRDFIRELRRLNMELSRTHGEERRYYERKKRRLWLSLIPFVRYR